MTPDERLYKPEYAHELLRLSESDLLSAQILAQGNARPETILFMAEQAVEKALKAVLCFLQQPIPISHEIILLVQKLGKKAPPHAGAIIDLTPFATIRRYEEGKAKISNEEVQAALKVVGEVVAWCTKEIIVGKNS